MEEKQNISKEKLLAAIQKTMSQIAKESDVVSPTTVIADLVIAFSHIFYYAEQFGEKELFEYLDKMGCRKIATAAVIWLDEAS